jgi:hypothetical protein
MTRVALTWDQLPLFAPDEAIGGVNPFYGKSPSDQEVAA